MHNENYFKKVTATERRSGAFRYKEHCVCVCGGGGYSCSCFPKLLTHSHTFMVMHAPVSYTHLDVYKRQVLQNIDNIPIL